MILKREPALFGVGFGNQRGQTRKPQIPFLGLLSCLSRKLQPDFSCLAAAVSGLGAVWAAVCCGRPKGKLGGFGCPKIFILTHSQKQAGVVIFPRGSWVYLGGGLGWGLLGGFWGGSREVGELLGLI